MVSKAIEAYHASHRTCPGALHLRGDHRGTTLLGRAGLDVERMKFVKELAVLFVPRGEPHGLLREIDHRCRRDANLRREEATARVGCRHRRTKVARPQRTGLRARVVGVEGKDRVVLRGHVHHVLTSDATHVERLGVHLSVDVSREHFAKRAGPHVGRREHLLFGVRSGTRQIVLRGQHVHVAGNGLLGTRGVVLGFGGAGRDGAEQREDNTSGGQGTSSQDGHEMSVDVVTGSSHDLARNPIISNGCGSIGIHPEATREDHDGSRRCKVRAAAAFLLAGVAPPRKCPTLLQLRAPEQPWPSPSALRSPSPRVQESARPPKGPALPSPRAPTPRLPIDPPLRRRPKRDQPTSSTLPLRRRSRPQRAGTPSSRLPLPTSSSKTRPGNSRARSPSAAPRAGPLVRSNAPPRAYARSLKRFTTRRPVAKTPAAASTTPGSASAPHAPSAPSSAPASGTNPRAGTPGDTRRGLCALGLPAEADRWSRLLRATARRLGPRVACGR